MWPRDCETQIRQPPCSGIDSLSALACFRFVPATLRRTKVPRTRWMPPAPQHPPPSPVDSAHAVAAAATATRTKLPKKWPCGEPSRRSRASWMAREQPTTFAMDETSTMSTSPPEGHRNAELDLHRSGASGREKIQTCMRHQFCKKSFYPVQGRARGVVGVYVFCAPLRVVEGVQRRDGVGRRAEAHDPFPRGREQGEERPPRPRHGVAPTRSPF